MKVLIRVFLVLTLVLLIRCNNDNSVGDHTGNQSVITSVTPGQVSIGQQDVTGSILGSNLSATSVSMGDGITVKKFTVKSSSEIQVEFNVSANAVAGSRTVTVTTSSGTVTSSSVFSVANNHTPKANFMVSPSEGSISTVFKFDGSTSTDPEQHTDIQYSWKFGDGSTAKGRKVEHKYAKTGTYDVELTASDKLAAFDVVSKSVKVTNTPPPPEEVVCTGSGSSHPPILIGTVVAIETGNWAIVNFGKGASCKTHWHKCDDMRRYNPEGFYGIVDKMTDRGDGILGVHNSCPYRWPPQVGEKVFLYYKTCTQNHCP